jgi:ABC-type Fe3+ transport system substrate-binding protein
MAKSSRLSQWLRLVVGFAVAAGMGWPPLASALPKATLDQLQSIGIDPSILADSDSEMVVPNGWIEAARKERKIRVSGSRDVKEFNESVRPFKERYPFISFEYTRASYGNRAMSILVAAQRGRVITDVMTGFGGSVAQFKEAGALESLRDVPNVKKVASDLMRDDDGFWVGHQVTHWCISYNTNLIKPDDLPKTWDDLLAKPIWRDGHLGLGNRPQLWVMPLWGVFGENWADAYVGKLFTILKPQLRREGINAMISLTAAGELYAALPGSGYRTQHEANDGAPVNFHCPEPVPMSINLMAILHGSPSVHAAKLFLNWTLSKEGQIAQYAADRSAPVHIDLQSDDRFVPYAQNIRGKRLAVRSASMLEDSSDKLFAMWNAHWEKGAR